MQALTVKRLKEFVMNLPEVDDVTGKDFEVWVGDDVSNPCTGVMKLNTGDVILISNVQAVDTDKFAKTELPKEVKAHTLTKVDGGYEVYVLSVDNTKPSEGSGILPLKLITRVLPTSAHEAFTAFMTQRKWQVLLETDYENWLNNEIIRHRFWSLNQKQYEKLLSDNGIYSTQLIVEGTSAPVMIVKKKEIDETIKGVVAITKYINELLNIKQ